MGEPEEGYFFFFKGGSYHERETDYEKGRAILEIERDKGCSVKT